MPRPLLEIVASLEERVGPAHTNLKELTNKLVKDLGVLLDKVGLRREENSHVIGRGLAAVFVRSPGNAEVYDSISAKLEMAKKLQACFNSAEKTNDKLNEVKNFVAVLQSVDTKKFKSKKDWEAFTLKATGFTNAALGIPTVSSKPSQAGMMKSKSELQAGELVKAKQPNKRPR